MNGITHFETFLIAGILLNLTPGNDTIFILTRSLAQGKKAGFISVAGIATGSLIHTSLAAFGLSLVIANSLLLFNMIKYAGAAYLIYLGYKMITQKTDFTSIHSDSQKPLNLFKIYREAVITNLLNPKVSLFFISFLPQFIDPQYRDSIFPFLVLGFTFTATGTTWCLVLAAFASVIAGKLRSDKHITGWIQKICGSVLIGLGLKVALTHRS